MLKFSRVAVAFSLGLALCAASVQSARAITVTGWGLETGATGATLTESTPGIFSVTAPTANAAPRASFSAFDFSVVGTSIQATAQVTFNGTQNFGNQSFRIGLFNNNGNPTGTLSGGAWTGSTSTGWLGYVAEAGNGDGTGTSVAIGRSGTAGSGAWFSGTSSYALTPNGTTSGTYVAGNTGTFNVALTLTRTAANTVNVSYSFVDTAGGTGNNYSTAATVVDTAGASSALASINQIGFLLNGSSGGAASFSNVSVAFVPEPSTYALVALGLAGVVAMSRCRFARA